MEMIYKKLGVDIMKNKKYGACGACGDKNIVDSVFIKKNKKVYLCKTCEQLISINGYTKVKKKVKIQTGEPIVFNLEAFEKGTEILIMEDI